VQAAGTKVLVIAEGLLIYLTREDVTSLAKHLHDYPAFSYWLMDLASPLLIKRLAKTWGKNLAQGNAPFRFAPPEGTAFFAPHGWKESEYRSMFEESIRLNRTFPFAKFWRMVGRLSPKKKQAEFQRMSGIVLFERSP
jgi:O-methyltransferase involved in polyketide biosynthesis